MDHRRSSRRFGAKMPGVSTRTTWALPSMKMPRTSARVVCTLRETIETLVPTRWFRSVDLPAFGTPISATKPAGRRWACRKSGDRLPVPRRGPFRRGVILIVLGHAVSVDPASGRVPIPPAPSAPGRPPARRSAWMCPRRVRAQDPRPQRRCGTGARGPDRYVPRPRRWGSAGSGPSPIPARRIWHRGPASPTPARRMEMRLDHLTGGIEPRHRGRWRKDRFAGHQPGWSGCAGRRPSPPPGRGSGAARLPR